MGSAEPETGAQGENDREEGTREVAKVQDLTVSFKQGDMKVGSVADQSWTGGGSGGLPGCTLGV